MLKTLHQMLKDVVADKDKALVDAMAVSWGATCSARLERCLQAKSSCVCGAESFCQWGSGRGAAARCLLCALPHTLVRWVWVNSMCACVFVSVSACAYTSLCVLLKHGIQLQSCHTSYQWDMLV